MKLKIRLGFLINNFGTFKDAGFFEICQAFFVALRFDLAVTCIFWSECM